MAGELGGLHPSTAVAIPSASPVSMPGLGKSSKEFSTDNFKVRYTKIDMDDLGSIAELEILKTRALRNDGIYIMSEDKFTFMDKYFIIVSYLEKDDRG